MTASNEKTGQEELFVFLPRYLVSQDIENIVLSESWNVDRFGSATSDPNVLAEESIQFMDHIQRTALKMARQTEPFRFIVINGKGVRYLFGCPKTGFPGEKTSRLSAPSLAERWRFDLDA